jgi:hypothetical protein
MSSARWHDGTPPTRERSGVPLVLPNVLLRQGYFLTLKPIFVTLP